jgi:hypothetical protein
MPLTIVEDDVDNGAANPGELASGRVRRVDDELVARVGGYRRDAAQQRLAAPRQGGADLRGQQEPCTICLRGAHPPSSRQQSHLAAAAAGDAAAPALLTWAMAAAAATVQLAATAAATAPPAVAGSSLSRDPRHARGSGHGAGAAMLLRLAGGRGDLFPVRQLPFGQPTARAPPARRPRASPATSTTCCRVSPRRSRPRRRPRAMPSARTTTAPSTSTCRASLSRRRPTLG